LIEHNKSVISDNGCEIKVLSGSVDKANILVQQLRIENETLKKEYLVSLKQTERNDR
jgi:hypothetical protein